MEMGNVDNEKNLDKRNTGFNFIVDFSPVCLASKGRVKWIRNGIEVKHPLILPPIPKEYMTFQCFASGHDRNIQRSVVVLVDETSPVVMNFTKLNDTDRYLYIECSGRAFPPPKIYLEVSASPPVEGSLIEETSQTISTYSSVQVIKLKKHLQITIKCIVHNEYYTQNEELVFLFPENPIPPPTQPDPFHTNAPEPTEESQENEVEVIKQKTVPEDLSNKKDDITETHTSEEETSTGTDLSYKNLLIYVISGVITALLISIILVCLVVRITRTHKYHGLRKREIYQVRGGATTSTSFAPYNKSPSPEDFYDIPTSHAIRKPPRSITPSGSKNIPPKSITPSGSKNNSLRKDKDLSLRKGATLRDPSIIRGTWDSSLKKNISIHPADELKEYTDMRTFGSLKRKTGQYTEVEKRATLHGVYVLPSPVPAPKYSQIRHPPPRDRSRDPVYDNLDLENEELYDTPRTRTSGEHSPALRTRTSGHYSPPFKKQETRSEYDKIKIDWDGDVQYDNMLRSGEPGTPFSDI